MKNRGKNSQRKEQMQEGNYPFSVVALRRKNKLVKRMAMLQFGQKRRAKGRNLSPFLIRTL